MSARREDSEQARRSTYVEHEVVYAEVGASADPDLQRFPPENSTPYFEEVQLGSGADRFVTASNLLMTWGAQRGAGIRIVDIVPGDGGQYEGVSFDEHGTPQPTPVIREDRFSADGEPFLTAGTTLRAEWDDPKRSARQLRVVYIIDEPRRIGFAWGTTDEEGATGEEVFVVEHREDDTVWASVTGFMRPSASGMLGMKGRLEIKRGMSDLHDQLMALAPGGAQADLGR